MIYFPRRCLWSSYWLLGRCYRLLLLLWSCNRLLDWYCLLLYRSSNRLCRLNRVLNWYWSRRRSC